MRNLLLLIISFHLHASAKAQDNKEQQQLKTITIQAFESVSQSTRQWFVDIAEKQPSPDFDSVYTKRMLVGKFSPGQLGETGELFVVMMAYLKMVLKEAREDRKIQAQAKKIVLASKEEKLQLENRSIEQGMKEAREKAEQAMNAAVTSLATGIISGAIQVTGGSVSEHARQQPILKDSTKPKSKIIPVSPHKKLPLVLYLKKLEAQLEILKKGVK